FLPVLKDIFDLRYFVSVCIHDKCWLVVLWIFFSILDNTFELSQENFCISYLFFYFLNAKGFVLFIDFVILWIELHFFLIVHSITFYFANIFNWPNIVYIGFCDFNCSCLLYPIYLIPHDLFD